MVFGAFVAFSLVPGFSLHLSSKHAVEAYQRFRKDNEPLAVYGPSRFFSQAKTLESLDDVVKWLERKDRVFAVFPPKNLPEIDRRMRDGTGKNIFNHDSKRYAPIRYGGHMTMAANDKSVKATGEILPMRQFPCPDSLGVVAEQNVKIEDKVPPLIAAVFWAEKVDAKKGAQLAGASAVWGEFKLGERVHMVATPNLPRCLPPGFDDNQMFRMTLDGWIDS